MTKYIIFFSLSFLLFTHTWAERQLGAGLSISNDGLNNSYVILPSFIYENEYIIASTGIGFNSSETSTNSQSIQKNDANSFFAELGFKLPINETLNVIYGTKFVFISGDYQGNSIETGSKISLTGGLLYSMNSNIKLLFLLDVYSTQITEWTPEGQAREEILRSTFLNGGKFGFVYTFL